MILGISLACFSTPRAVLAYIATSRVALRSVSSEAVAILAVRRLRCARALGFIFAKILLVPAVSQRACRVQPAIGIEKGCRPTHYKVCL